MTQLSNLFARSVGSTLHHAPIRLHSTPRCERSLERVARCSSLSMSAPTRNSRYLPEDVAAAWTLSPSTDPSHSSCSGSGLRGRVAA